MKKDQFLQLIFLIFKINFRIIIYKKIKNKIMIRQ
ncbi:hypothetical protein M8044_000433 [Columbia Basin potato purple top phytoplasma]|uniref:Uncharacterized protein n=1 Tax=Columbia Basin potato purple top phytoplasma TaxID=307134 RepID=A0ABT5LAK2_9MOLU|nr:hypothetical protein [Columbia Basin potato purple top phytoplasma]